MDEELVTVATKAYRSLRRRILQGELEPGQQLAQQRLARQMSIGTNPLREAMVRLECDGLIEIVPQWGARVRAWSDERIAHLYDLREAIECQTARLCALRASEEQLAGLAASSSEVDAIDDAVMSDTRRRDFVKEVIPWDARFHLRIAELAASPLLLEQFERQNVMMQMVRAMRLAGPDFPTEHLEHSHANLAKAIATRDPDVAAAVMREHIYSGLRVVSDSAAGAPERP